MEVEDFLGTPPEYAILSHTWGDGELNIQEMLNPTEEIKARSGYSKIEGCAAICRRDGKVHVWIDTICIDKTSSAELSEAINSMWRWYQEATLCYVYLEDVSLIHNIGGGWELIGTLEQSKWFTRGWTLQELIAPREMKFFSKEWKDIGTKGLHLHEISSITHIDAAVLASGNLETTSVAQRMSWAANRKTTRTEDVAYCLLGLLDVKMPLLYGEGAKAFQRLQEELIKISSDLSIFSWGDARDLVHKQHFYRGLLARSPYEFSSCGGISASRDFAVSNPYKVTNHGLSLRLNLLQTDEANQIYLADLGCRNAKDEFQGIYLKRLSRGGDQFARIWTDQQAAFPSPLDIERKNLWVRREKIFVRQKVSIPNDHSTTAISGFIIDNLNLQDKPTSWSGLTIKSCSLSPPLKIDGRQMIRIVQPSELAVAVLTISSETGASSNIASFHLILGYNETDGAWWEIAPIKGDEESGDQLANTTRGTTELSYRKELPGNYNVALDARKSLHDDQLVVVIRLNVSYDHSRTNTNWDKRLSGSRHSYRNRSLGAAT
jgi:hypothetical protein